MKNPYSSAVCSRRVVNVHDMRSPASSHSPTLVLVLPTSITSSMAALRYHADVGPTAPARRAEVTDDQRARAAIDRGGCHRATPSRTGTGPASVAHANRGEPRRASTPPRSALRRTPAIRHATAGTIRAPPAHRSEGTAAPSPTDRGCFAET